MNSVLNDLEEIRRAMMKRDARRAYDGICPDCKTDLSVFSPREMVYFCPVCGQKLERKECRYEETGLKPCERSAMDCEGCEWYDE